MKANTLIFRQRELDELDLGYMLFCFFSIATLSLAQKFLESNETWMFFTGDVFESFK